MDRDQDPYAWALQQADLVKRGSVGLRRLDRSGLADFLEEWADEMLAAVRSQIVNLMTHAAKAAFSRNPDVIGHWRSECTEFHDRLVDGYRNSMREKIDMESLWRRARRKVLASFADHDEATPTLSARCPVTVDDLVNPDLDVENLVGIFSDASKNPYPASFHQRSAR